MAPERMAVPSPVLESPLPLMMPETVKVPPASTANASVLVDKLEIAPA